MFHERRFGVMDQYDSSVVCNVTLFNLSVEIDFLLFMTYLGTKEHISRGAIFFDPPDPVFQGGAYGRSPET